MKSKPLAKLEKILCSATAIAAAKRSEKASEKILPPPRRAVTSRRRYPQNLQIADFGRGRPFLLADCCKNRELFIPQHCCNRCNCCKIPCQEQR